MSWKPVTTSGEEVFAATARVGADERAWKLLAPIFNAGASPTANQIAKLLKWAPVLEMLAYECFTTASMLVDRDASEAFDGASARH